MIKAPALCLVSNVQMLIEPGHVIEDAMTVNMVFEFENPVEFGAWRRHDMNFKYYKP